MTPVQLMLFAATLFLALASLLNWKSRRHLRATRMERCLRVYLTKGLAGWSDNLAGAAWRTA